MSSGTSTQSTQSSQVNQIPQWVSDAGQQNYAFAQQVANQPLTQYQGQMVADTSPQTQQSWDLAAQSGNVGQDQYGASQAGYLNSLGQNVQPVTDPGNAASIRASTIAGSNLSPYMNPFTSSVINATMPIYQQALGTQQVGNQNQASGANAFGGSRMGVQQGVTQAQGAQGMAQMAAGLNQSNFQQAQAAAQADAATRNAVATTNQSNQQANLNRNLAAQTTNQTAAQAKINSDILSSQGLANLGDSQVKANAANYTMLSQAGASQQGQAQDQINAQMAKFQQANSYPQQQLATLLSALGMTPHDTASTGTTDQQTTTPTNWGNLALQGMQTLGSMFMGSDETMKTDITKLGKDKTTGLQMHAFRYKGDPKTYPKVVGPMAQEVESKFPGMTKKQGGKLTVDPRVAKAAGVQGFEDGTDFVGAPNMDDAELGSQIMGDDGGPMAGGFGGLGSIMQKIGKGMGGAFGGDKNAASPKPADDKMPQGWGAPSMGYFVSGYSGGINKVPAGPKIPGALAMGTDTVPAMLTPGEAVLNQRAATQLGRGKIAQLNAGVPPSSPLVTAGLKSMGPRTLASFMPPKKAFGAATTAIRGGAKSLGGMSNTKIRGALA
jgi:hypothetical protein